MFPVLHPLDLPRAPAQQLGPHLRVRQPGPSILVGTFLQVFLVLAVPAYCLILVYAWMFPFGWSHSCIRILSGELSAYADIHGHFPAGQQTPEASLSLLYHKGFGVGAETLRGKTVPLSLVERILSEGGLLGADTCGWHYVEGLTHRDDRHLAILWDKVGLGHNGERLFPPGHEVLFLNGDVRIIRKADWQTFLEEQEELRAGIGKRP